MTDGSRETVTAMVRPRAVMLLWILILGHALGAPADEFEELTSIAEEETLPTEEKFFLNILPGYAPDFDEIYKKNYVSKLAGLEMDNAYVENLNKWIEKGTTRKGLTFNVYNDEMREAAISLFRLFQAAEGEDFVQLRKWAEKHINTEMYLYALRLASLYSSNISENHILPPFISNPRYFVNSEAITKAFTILDAMRENKDQNPDIAEIDQNDYWLSSYRLPGRFGDFITVNSNYSGWNHPNNGIEKEINYFREDIGLNTYYMGLHLLHPFWMTNEELDDSFPRHAEHYYYAHQQLMARYLLEKEHLQETTPSPLGDESDYVSYLSHSNGLPFPTRSCVRGDWDSEKALIKSIDIAIGECINRGLIVMQNGTYINMTEDYHIEELSRLIRANLDGIKTAKVVRSVFGYGSNRFPVDEYNPAPSLLHYPETSLRDPAYWFLIKYMLNYFTEYKNTMGPYDLSQFETEDIIIQNTNDMDNINFTTYFQSYRFTLNYARGLKPIDDETTYMSVRQRRLKHKPIEIKLSFVSSARMKAVLRLYLGPQCKSNCWQENSKFFELDTYTLDLDEGLNVKTFRSKFSKKHSFDGHFDSIRLKDGIVRKSHSYSIFKFPENLLIPHGTEKGLNLTLFVMITPFEKDQTTDSNKYSKAVKLCDSKPLGFPFHRPALAFKESASNYRFFNITVYHKTEVESLPSAFFSPHLY